MFNQFLCTIFMTIPSVFQALSMEHILNAKGAKTKSWQRILLWVIIFLAGSSVKTFVNDYGITKNFTGIYGMLSFVVFLPIFYKDPIWKKGLVMIAMILGMSVSEIALLPAVKAAGLESMTDWDYTKTKVMMITGISAVISIVGIWLVTMLLNKMFHGRKLSKYIWIFCIYGIYQTAAFYHIPELLVDGDMNYFVYGSVIFSMLCSVVLLFIAFSQAEKERLEAELNEAEQEMKLKKIHFQEVEKRREELAVIMSENNQFVLNTTDLLKAGEIKAAESELMKRLKHLGETKEYPYCGIPIVNVILTKKQKECESRRIELEIETNLKEMTGIKQLDLCCVFSNILDNAIRACSYLKADTNEYPMIQLKAGVVGEYLIIKCENLYRSDMEHFPEGTGYGLKILRDVADRYQGSFQTEENENTFKVQMSLRVS